MNFLGFKKVEIIVVSLTLVTIGVAIYLNLRISLRRERDFQRKSDIWAIHDALIAYMNDESSFPPSHQGKIVACFGGVDESEIPQRVPCEWHKDPLPNIFKDKIYLENLPTDPHHNQGARYYYISNGRYFQLYAALEGQDEDEYNKAIVARNIMCGVRRCNYGKGFGETPLDKSIEEYENELREKNEKTPF